MIEILPGVELDKKQERVIFAVQDHTIDAGVTLTVTRGHSSPLEQLKIIDAKAQIENCKFSEFVPGNLHDKVEIWRAGQPIQAYRWQQTWSMLLQRGQVVNPPLAAVCLEHYVRYGGEDMFGKIIYPSPHIISDAVDFSARVDRGMSTEKKDIVLVTTILLAAQKAGAGIRFVKPEPRNMCVHIDLEA